MNKKILFLILLSFLILPGTVLAQPIENMVSNIVKVVIFTAGGIVVIIWAVTGILFLSSMGAPEKLSTAKKSLFAAIAGTVLVILAFLAGVIIENAILRGI